MFDNRDKSFNHEEREKKNDDQKKIVRFSLNPLDKSISIAAIWSEQRECAAKLQNDDRLMNMDVYVCSACHYISCCSFSFAVCVPRCVVGFTASRHGGMYIVHKLYGENAEQTCYNLSRLYSLWLIALLCVA